MREGFDGDPIASLENLQTRRGVVRGRPIAMVGRCTVTTRKVRQMDLSERLQIAINNSVLCWLATVDADGQPNVSPKEIFCMGTDPNEILIAEIASPVSRRNISTNPRVCISAIDVFVQKGIKAYGNAVLLTPADPHFAVIAQPLAKMAGADFKIRVVIRVSVDRIAPIVAPSYALFPERTEDEQRQRAFESYGVKASN